MKPRTLMILAFCCALLAALALVWLKREPAGPPPEIGARLLRTDDINRVTRIEIESGTQTVRLARGDAGWTVESRWNFPARFDQIAGVLRELDQLRVVEIIRGGAEILPDVGLVEDGTNVPATIRLFTGGDKPSDVMHIGKPRAAAAMGHGFQLPDSRYARRANGPVVLVEPFMNDPPRRPADWLRSLVLDLRASEVVRMMAVPTNQAMYAISRADDGAYSGVGGLHEQPINAPAADLWFRAFQGLVVRDVVDPSIPRDRLGAAETDLAAAYLKNGLVARVELGGAAGDEGQRYAWFTFDYEGPEEGDETFGEDHAHAKKELDRLNREVAPWRFVLGGSQADKFIFLRDQLIAASAESPAPQRPD